MAMVDINPDASGLRAQLQAQLQTNKASTTIAAKAPTQITPRPQDVVEERQKARGDDQNNGRRIPLPTKGRGDDLSSPKELADAEDRVNQFTGNTSLREAPTGRTSAPQNELRNQPLGQIVDIRV